MSERARDGNDDARKPDASARDPNANARNSNQRARDPNATARDLLARDRVRFSHRVEHAAFRAVLGVSGRLSDAR
ncbi:MAG: hypothetical protein ACRELT_12575, partial [Longimicrobiales bacterium]